MDETDDFLAHYGVKGMKWGVRRAEKKQAVANSLKRVGEGKGNFDDDVAAVRRVTGVDMIRGKGYRGGAAVRGAKIQKSIDKSEKVAAYKQAKSDQKKAQKEAYRGKIDKARDSLESKGLKTDEAKQKYKEAKKAEGRRSVEAFKAKQEWNKAYNDLERTRGTANQIRDGKEVAEAMFMGMTYMKYRYV